MDLSKIIVNSVKYPFKNLIKLPIIFILFILIAIVPFGWIFNNRFVVLIGVIAFFLFILIVPGYMLGIVRKGSIESSVFPSFNVVNTSYDAVRVLALRIVYMIVPAVMFFIALSTLGVSGIDSLSHFQVSGLASIGLALILILVSYMI